MSGFDGNWLALRADADARACERSTPELLGRAFGPGAVRALRVVDLGAGSGNNAARLGPLLARAGAASQTWVLVDDDPALLARAVERLARSSEEARPPRTVETLTVDLAGGAPADLLDGADLVTCSALLDLASRAWIDQLARALRDAAVPLFLTSLDIDGRVRWEPTDPFDARAAAAFDADMRRDKGLGLAVAGAAPATAADALDRAGFAVHTAPSPWRLRPGDQALQLRYLEDVAAVALGAEPGDEVEGWRARRRAWIERGESCLTVGHSDTLGVLRSRSKSTSAPIA
ncbi:MAG: class I SAM-dependent methyltransferase [Planctomycetota bacterium]